MKFKLNADLFKRHPFFQLYEFYENQYTKRGIVLFTIVYIGSLLLSGIISPFFYEIFQYWYKLQPLGFLEYLTQKNFNKYIDRIRWIPIIFCFPFILKDAQLLSWKKLGVDWTFFGVRDMLKGFLIGVILITPIISLQFIFYSIQFKHSFGFKLISIIGLCLMSAWIVSLIEEIILRGFLFRAFYSFFKTPVVSIIITSIIYSYFHFVKGVNLSYSLEDINVFFGIKVSIAYLFSFLSHFKFIHFLNLTLLGIILSLLYIQRRKLNISIGLHAGVIFGMLLYTRLVNVQTSDYIMMSQFLGNKYLVNGVMATLILGILCIFLCFKKSY